VALLDADILDFMVSVFAIDDGESIASRGRCPCSVLDLARKSMLVCAFLYAAHGGTVVCSNLEWMHGDRPNKELDAVYSVGNATVANVLTVGW